MTDEGTPADGASEVGDEALASRAADGDDEAFAMLVDRHYQDCLRYATRFLGERADAEEAVQETFLRVYRALAGYESRRRFRGWLFRILVNCCRTAASRASRRWQRLVRYAVSMGPGWQAPPSVDDRMGRIEEALGRLPELQREAFLLRHMEELEYEEMADLTGATVAALRMRVSRAGQSLREDLRDLYEGGPGGSSDE